MEEGITLNPGSHVYVRKTPGALFVNILHGEALLRAREASTRRPVVVRAGNAQIRNYDAVVCVDVDGERASVDVIHGVATVGNVDAESRVINEVTLRAGDRAGVSSGPHVMFRLNGSGDEGERRPCGWSAGVD